MSSSVRLTENAAAKVNLTLRVLRRRDDGYHDIESLVAFASCGDTLSFAPGPTLALAVSGPNAAGAGAEADNLVLKAARALAALIPDLNLGAFDLEKNLPVAAGLGGGSADAAAALRLLARANGLAAGDARLYAAARATGADVPVCVDPRPRVMAGIGEKLSEPLQLPSLHAVLVNPGVAVATKAVFARWRAAAGESSVHESSVHESSAHKSSVDGSPNDFTAMAKVSGVDELLQLLAARTNDLENPAIALAPVIAEMLAALRALPGCRLARMSGSGATCLAVFAGAAAADAAAKILAGKYPHYWVRATVLGSG